MAVNLWNKLTRKKVVDLKDTETELARVLTAFDLTLLGIGSTLGVGIYVLAGSVARNCAGPAVVISFFIAAVASVLAGLCYAEFGARVPKAGSAYIYSYVCVGELIAFIVGWNLIMEYVIGVASVARGYSGYVDSLFDGEMHNAFKSLTIDMKTFSVTFDFFAFGITLILTIILAFGVKESTIFNNIFTCLNLLVVLFVIVAGSFKADPGNWNISLSDVNISSTDHHGHKIDPGEGGFAPFGFAGIMRGAATCFYGFVGFDVIATTGEEAKNPQRAIPLAIIFSLLFVFVAYFGVSTVITMMSPYYLQDVNAPLPYAFKYANFEAGKWVVNIGALFGLSTSLLGAMFPMPRVIWAMASDGLLFAFLSKIHPRFKTPFIATIISGLFGSLMAGLFNLEVLIDMMSIGTLTAYTLVAVCVLILRYKKEPLESEHSEPSKHKFIEYVHQIFNIHGHGKGPTILSSNYSAFAVLTFCILSFGLCSVAIFGADLIIDMNYCMIALLSVFAGLEALLILSLALQPVSRTRLSFRVPLVPYIPALSIITNVYLILKLSGATWIRFFVWMVVGLLIYAYCLFSGRADRVYASSNPANKRKYSRISLNVINTNTLPAGHALRSKGSSSKSKDEIGIGTETELNNGDDKKSDGKLSTDLEKKLSSIFNDDEKPRVTSIANNNFRLSFTGIKSPNRNPRPMSEGHHQTTSFSAKHLNSRIDRPRPVTIGQSHTTSTNNEGENSQPILKKIILISSADENPTPHLEFKPISPAPRAQERELNGLQSYLHDGYGEPQKVSDSKSEKFFAFYPEEGPPRSSLVQKIENSKHHSYSSGNRNCYFLKDENEIKEFEIDNRVVVGVENLGKSGEEILGLGLGAVEDNKKVVDDHKLKVSPEVGQDAIKVVGIEEFEEIKGRDKNKANHMDHGVKIKVFKTLEIPAAATVVEKCKPTVPVRSKPPIVNIIEIQADVNQVDDDEDLSSQSQFSEPKNEQSEGQTIGREYQNEGKESQNKNFENQTEIQTGQVKDSIAQIQLSELKNEQSEGQTIGRDSQNEGKECQNKDFENQTEIKTGHVKDSITQIQLSEPTNEPNEGQIFSSQLDDQNGGEERQNDNQAKIQVDTDVIHRVVNDLSSQTQILESNNEPTNEGEIFGLVDQNEGQELQNKDHDNQVEIHENCELSTECSTDNSTLEVSTISNGSSNEPHNTTSTTSTTTTSSNNSNSNNNKQSGNNRRRKRR